MRSLIHNAHNMRQNSLQDGNKAFIELAIQKLAFQEKRMQFRKEEVVQKKNMTQHGMQDAMPQTQLFSMLKGS